MLCQVGGNGRSLGRWRRSRRGTEPNAAVSSPRSPLSGSCSRRTLLLCTSEIDTFFSPQQWRRAKQSSSKSHLRPARII